MPQTNLTTDHYTHGALTNAIRSGIAALGKHIDDLCIDDLAPVDEFHVGGRLASVHFLDQLDLHADHQVLDVGCGLGGSARFTASRYGCDVTGIDLTPEYIATGNTLTEWVGLTDKVSLQVGDVTQLDFGSARFERIYMMHVGMNIADKHALFDTLSRLLRPGGLMGIYDIMRIDDGDLTYPLPWASVPAGSEVVSPDVYEQAINSAGLELVHTEDRRAFALEFFDKLRARTEQAGGPPPLGLHIVMGERFPDKIRNMVAGIARDILAPVELLARKPQ